MKQNKTKFLSEYQQIYKDQKKQIIQKRKKMRPEVNFHISPFITVPEIFVCGILFLILIGSLPLSSWATASVIITAMIGVIFFLMRFCVEERWEEDRLFLPVSWFLWKRMVAKALPFPKQIQDSTEIIPQIIDARLIRIKFEKDSLTEKINSNFQKITKAIQKVREVKSILDSELDAEFYEVRKEAVLKAENNLLEDLQTVNNQAEQLEQNYRLIQEEIDQLTRFYTQQFKIKAITDAFLTSEDFRKENEVLNKRLELFANSCDEVSCKFKVIEGEVKFKDLAEIQVLSW